LKETFAVSIIVRDAGVNQDKREMSDYDVEVKLIRADNQPILDGFQSWLEGSGLAPKTVKSHLVNIDFFAEYLTYYEPLLRLTEADAVDVYGFLRNWYPRKAMWASEANTRSYMASFRKFFKYLKESNQIQQSIVDDVQETLRENKEEFLEAVAFDDDEYEW
jgi:site-specific recombinase XerD